MAKERTKKEEARKELILNPDFQHLKHPMKKDIWESDNWSSSHWPDESWTSAAGCFCTKAHGAWMVAIPLNLAMHGIMALRRSFAVENNSFVFANSETETCMESCILHFPTAPPCSTKVVVLETVTCPPCFPSLT